MLLPTVEINFLLHTDFCCPVVRKSVRFWATNKLTKFFSGTLRIHASHAHERDFLVIEDYTTTLYSRTLRIRGRQMDNNASRHDETGSSESITNFLVIYIYDHVD